MNYTNLIKRERTLFWLTFLVGVAACTVDGVGRTESYGWLHPVSISGTFLGVSALILAANLLFDGPLGERASLIALLGIIVLKVILAQLYVL